MTSLRPLVHVGLAGLLAWWATERATAQIAPAGPDSVPALAIRPGVLVERITSRADSSQSYALYVPSRYRTDARWPILFLMDPRGRALIPMGLVRPAAERLGYLVLSSYNTMSDGPMQPNIVAMQAMLADAQRLLAIDPRRLYLVGFSGTARVGWDFAPDLQGHLAGLIGFGAGLPPGVSVPPVAVGDGGLVYFGGAGNTDFNYEEMRALEPRLERFRIPYRIEYWEGPHAWPPEEVVTRAVEWMELNALTRGLVPSDAERIDSAFAVEMERARSLESSGRTFEAYRDYRAIVRDFARIHGTGEPEARARALEQSEVVRRTTAELAAAAERHEAYLRKLGVFVEQMQRAKRPPPLGRSLEQLEVGKLQRTAAGRDQPNEALAAQRLLEQAFLQTSFYQPRRYLEQGDPTRALALLEVANAIKPDDPSVCYRRAQAFLQLGRREEALDQVERLARTGQARAERLEADSSLAALRDDPRFRAAVAQLRARTLERPRP